jgi:hypothetical protein
MDESVRLADLKLGIWSFSEAPSPGGGWGFRRRNSANAVKTTASRSTNLLQLHPIRAIPRKERLHPVLSSERH